MNVELLKYEPVWKEEINDAGDKAKVRKLKLSIYVDPAEFPDVTAYDGATMKLFRPEESITGDVDSIRVKQMCHTALKEAIKFLEL